LLSLSLSLSLCLTHTKHKYALAMIHCSVSSVAHKDVVAARRKVDVVILGVARGQAQGSAVQRR